MTLPISKVFPVMLVFVAAWQLSGAAQAAGPSEEALIDRFEYPDSAAAQAAWAPMAGSAPVAVATKDGRNVVRFPCAFSGTQTERGSWDRQINLDMAACAGVQFDVFCADASPVSYFSLYFQSGDGWYHGSFFPESSTGWSTIRFDKADLSTEGKPTGWGQVKAIRISAWRGKEVSTEFYLRDLRKTGLLGIDAPVAIIRADSAVERAPAETAGIRRTAETMRTDFEKAGIGAVILSDREVSAGHLRKARLVVLPNNPAMTERAQDELVQYLNAGGKLLAFYAVPERLRAALGIAEIRHLRAQSPGQFSKLRFREGTLPGAPREVAQRSWNINVAKEGDKGIRVLADWLDEKGEATGQPAVVGSDNYILMTHVLLVSDAAARSQLLLAMAGQLAPDLWRISAEATLARVGVLGGFRTCDEACDAIKRSKPGDRALAEKLASARRAREASLSLMAESKFADAIAQASAAERAMEAAFCMAQESAPGEFRAFWCHSAFGVDGIEWDEAIRRLATNGFNAILPNMLWGGVAYYPSELLPVAAQVANRGDQIQKCLEACRRYGVKMHVWKVNWNLGYAAPREFLESMRQERRLQANLRGQEEPWLCPSHPLNRKLEIDSMVEVARRYDVDGIHFDYIRYPDGEHCFCDGCRTRFQEATGLTVGAWPESVTRPGALRNAWLDWRRENITAVVKAVSEQARAIRPGIQISAAVFPNWNTDRDGVGQDWKLWCEKGYVDFVCPMDYTGSNSDFDNRVLRQVGWAGKTPCYPGIGLSASSPRLGIDGVIEQIRTTRRHKTGGFTIFNYAVRESAEILPKLGLGITKVAQAQTGLSDGPTPSGRSELGVQSVKLAASPLVLKDQDTGQMSIIASIESGGLTNATITLVSPAWPEAQTRTGINLGKGKQTVALTVPRLEATTPIEVRIQSNAAEGTFGPFQVAPPRHWTVYLTQHTHTDIGYTRPQTEILPEHIRYIDYALEYCDLTDAYPDDARFRWTCETSWAVREYLKRRPAEQVERFKRRIRDGRIEVCGLMLNMSEIAGESSLAALLRPLRAMKDEFDLPVRTAMQNDVNGAGWCLADYFPEVGIRYLTMGINQTRSILPFDKPTTFWWESPAGNRVLAYRSDHYHLGNFWHIHDGKLDPFKPGLTDYLVSLEQRQYPFDRIGVQFSGYHTDNSPPSTAACDIVKEWNERYEWPKLRLSTAQEFLGYVEKEHSADLPVFRAAWPDWWTDGFGSAARETAAARESESALQASQGLLAMATGLGARPSPGAIDRVAAIQDDLLFYAEHTFGAAESINDRLAENTQVQWGEKSSYVWTGVKNSNLLREEALGQVQDFLPRAEVPTLAVFNTLNWPRSGLVRVFIDHQILPPDRDFRIVDGSEPVLAQAMERRAEGTYWALWVRDVPPLGYKVLRIESSDQPRPKQSDMPEGLALENRHYRISLDAQRGAITSLIDQATGEELVDQSADWALGQCFYETMPANREMKPGVFKHTTVRNVKVKPGANGPIWKSLLVSANLDGCDTNNGLRAEIRLFETDKRVELHFAARKLAVASPESVYVAFPFRSPNGQMLYEAQGGLVVPGKDQIPGSSSDWQTLQSFIAVRNPQTQIILGSEEAPLVQLGGLNLGKWQPVTRVEKPHVYSWVMNNYWFTNFRTEQEGEFKWHYYLTSTRDMDRAVATRFGWGSRIPLVTRVLPPAKSRSEQRARELSVLTINAPNVLLVEARPARERTGGVVLHLRELEGKTTVLTQGEISTRNPLEGADEVNAIEEPIREGIDSLTLKPFETKFVRLWFQE